MRKKKTWSRRGTSAEPMAPSAHGPESLILNAFRLLSANDIYTMTPKESVVRGYDYYKQQRLRHYLWSPDHAALTASVQGQMNRPYAVTFSLDEGFFTAACDCPVWDPDRLCKHVLCACFTTKNLLSPDAFRLPWFEGTHRDRLEADLLGSESQDRHREAVGSKAGLEIVIDARHGTPSLLLRRDGMKVAWSSGWVPTQALPPELVPLLHASTFMPATARIRCCGICDATEAPIR